MNTNIFWIFLFELIHEIKQCVSTNFPIIGLKLFTDLLILKTEFYYINYGKKKKYPQL